MMAVPSTSKSIFHLYMSTLRTARTFNSYNFRRSFLSRTQSTLREIQSEQDPAKGPGFYQQAVKQKQAVREVPRIERTKGLFERKGSVEGLSTRDLLRWDYEEYRLRPSWTGNSTATTIQIGMSTVPRDLKEWIPSDPEFWTACEKYIDERNLSALGILAVFKAKMNTGKTKIKRRMLWIARDEGEVEAELRERLWKGLEASKVLKVKVTAVRKLGGGEYGVNMGDRVRYYRQGNSEMTRKTTAPIVRNIVQGGVGANGKL